MSSTEKIQAIWQNQALANEIEACLNKNNLSLDKLIACCDRKKQDVRIAMGVVLAMNDANFRILQCECGEIFSYPKNKRVQKNACCKKCDPLFFQKMMRT